ncbi:hypothetical protein Tco_1516794 [Tanacetum coccineum]
MKTELTPEIQNQGPTSGIRANRGTQNASDTGAAPKQQQQGDSSNIAILNIKLLILKKEEYDIWAMEMEHYLEYIDNDVWKVIQNGNSKKRISTGKDGVIRILPPVTAAEIQAVEKERKAKNILLMAIPKEHMRRFHGMDDAKEIWEAIRTSSRRVRNGYDRFQQLLSQLEAHGAELDGHFLLYDDPLHITFGFLSRNSMVPQNLSSAQIVAFVSQSKAALIKVKSGFSGATIDDLDIEEMDINWQIAMIAIRMKKFYKKNKEEEEDCTRKGTHDGKKKRDSFYQHQKAGKQEKNKMGLLTMDDGIVNWGEHTEDEEINHALMAISSSSEMIDPMNVLPVNLMTVHDLLELPLNILLIFDSEISRVPQEVYVSKPITTNEKDQDTPKVNERRIGNAMMERGTRGRKMAERLYPKKQRVFNMAMGVTKTTTNVNTVWTNINSVRQNVNFVWSNVNTGSFNVNSVRLEQPVPTSTSPNFSSERPKGSAVKTSAGYNWRTTRPNSNCNGGPTFIRTDHPLKNMVDRGIFDSGCSGHMTGNKDQLEDFEELIEELDLWFLWYRVCLLTSNAVQCFRGRKERDTREEEEFKDFAGTSLDFEEVKSAFEKVNTGGRRKKKRLKLLEREKNKFFKKKQRIADSYQIRLTLEKSLEKGRRAKQVHLDSLIAQRMAEEQESTEEQKKRKAQVQFEAQSSLEKIGILLEQSLKQI